SLDFELEVAVDGLCFWAVLGCWVPTWGRPTFFLFLDLPICQRIVFCESSFQSPAANFLRRQQNSKKMAQNPKIWISVGTAGRVWYAKYLSSLRLLNTRTSVSMACCLLSCFNRTVFSRRSGGDSSFSSLF